MHSILKKNLFSIASNTTIILFTQNIAINSFNLKNERSVFFSTADNLNLFTIQIVSPQKSLANIRLNTAEFFSRKIKKVRSRQHIEDLIFAFCFKIRASRQKRKGLVSYNSTYFSLAKSWDTKRISARIMKAEFSGSIADCGMSLQIKSSANSRQLLQINYCLIA